MSRKIHVQIQGDPGFKKHTISFYKAARNNKDAGQFVTIPISKKNSKILIAMGVASEG